MRFTIAINKDGLCGVVDLHTREVAKFNSAVYAVEAATDYNKKPEKEGFFKALIRGPLDETWNVAEEMT